MNSSPGALLRAKLNERRGLLVPGCGNALAARVIREVSALVRRSSETDRRLPTLSVDTEIRFRAAPSAQRFPRAAPIR